MTAKLEDLLYSKQYEQVGNELANISRESLPAQAQILYDMAKIRLQIWQITALHNEKADFNKFQILINESCSRFVNQLPQIVIIIHAFAMRAFLFQVQTNQQGFAKQQKQRKFIKQITKLPPITETLNEPLVVKLIDKSLYFHISLLQLYIKKNTRIKKKQQKGLLDKLQQLIEILTKKHAQTAVLSKRMFMIVIHMKLHNSNNFSNDLHGQTLQYLDICIKFISGVSQTLINPDTVVVLLYNCLKNMLGFNELTPALVDRLQDLYKLFQIKNTNKSYPTHILQMFFIIKIMIFKKKEQIEQNDKIQEKLSQFSQKFSVFLNLNMDEIVVSLNQITRNIIRHKVASLCTIISIKLGIVRFSKDFLQIMHDSPFNNDVQTIKLCFELFQFLEFQKIQNLLQAVLSVPATKSLKMREVLVAMCSILIGLYLEHREQGLLYGKLNHESFLAHKISPMIVNKVEILKQETFLQHVGFGYYNIACHQVYLQNRQIYLAKALQNFLNSYKLNNQNYLLNYCIGKIYLQFYDYQNAYKHAMEACKSHRSSWAPFCLLACVYMCDRKFQKSYMLIDELLKKYENVPLLHYVKAYLQVNKLLLEVEHDQQIQAAKMLGEQFYITHFERLLKHKSINSITQYAQSYFQLSMNHAITDSDQHFFTSQNISAADAINGQKYLYQIISLLEQIGQYNMIENILKILPQNNIQTLYHRAVLHMKRKQRKEARNQFLNILKLNHEHCPTLLKLAMLPENQSMLSYRECEEYLQMVGKFIDDGEFMMAKGIVASKLKKIEQANLYLLTTRQLAWCNLLPDLFFYY